MPKSINKVTTTVDQRAMNIEQNAKREMQRTVTHSKLDIKTTVGRKCLYLLHQLYDNRNKLHCVQQSDESWLLWDFDSLQAPKFEDDDLKLAKSFPVYCNVYQVCVYSRGCTDKKLS